MPNKSIPTYCSITQRNPLVFLLGLCLLLSACGTNNNSSNQSATSNTTESSSSSTSENTDNTNANSGGVTNPISESATPPPTSGSTFFIDTNGSDSNDGSEVSPWQTLQHAADSVGPGDTINVNSGIYVGARFEQSGTTEAWIILQAAPEASVQINGPGPNNRHESVLEFENWNGDEIIAYWMVQGLEVTGAPNWGIDMRGNETDHSHHFIIRNNIVHDNGFVEGKSGIFFAFMDDIVAEGNESYHNGEHGVYLSNSGDRFLVRGNSLHDNNNCGLHINGDLESGEDGIISDGIVENNVIFENGLGGCAGINMDGVTDSIIRNNLLYENHGSGIALFQENGAVCTQNIQVLNNTIVQAEDGRWGIIINGDNCVNNKIFNNIILTSHEWRGSIVIPTTEIAGFESDNNIIMNRLSADDDESVVSLSEWQSLGYDQNSIIASQEDVFFAPGNYHLDIDSPAVGTGITLENVIIDIEWILRPQFEGYDIGAFEFTGLITEPLPDSTEITAPTPTPITEQPPEIISEGGTITYFFDGNAFRISAEEGATPENLSEALDQLSVGDGDGLVNISPDGEWILIDAERFDTDCEGWACFVVISSDLSFGEVIRSGGEPIHSEGIGAIASGGNLVIYSYGDGPHEIDIWAVSRSGDIWGSPVLLTADSPYPYNNQMAISDDGSTVVFNCGEEPYGGEDTAICEVGTEGDGFRIVIAPADSPPGYPSTGGLYQPDYAPDGSIVFEAAWDGEQIWRLLPGASVPVLISDQFSNDNSPCVLPDGRVVSLWLDRDGGNGLHEMKVMSPDGSSFFMILPNIDILDAGLGCGE